ncbi:MAG: hypothetical protein Q9220_003696 [cf. Caloplaca sp. 1 TL-2023]
MHPDNNGFIDAAAAALFTACKIEDTLKKSRDILCAAHNLKLTAAEQVTPDDPIFENHAKIIIGVERLMLEASGFDFRNRYPQRLVLKFVKLYALDKGTVGKTAYNMCLDLYRTYSPLKQTTSAMALACVELATRVTDVSVPDLEEGKTLLDLVDLYTHHRASTIVGQDHALEKFISIRITLNQEASTKDIPRFTQSKHKNAPTNGAKTNGIKDHKSPKGVTSPRDIVSPKDIKSPQSIGLNSVNGTPVQGKPGLKEGTIRFMLDPERARDEKHTVAEFFAVDEEEYEVEVENDRRRDSAVGMNLSSEEEADTGVELHLNMEQCHQSSTRNRVKESEADKENYPTSIIDDGVPSHQPCASERTPKAPLAEQGVAFRTARQQSTSGVKHKGSKPNPGQQGGSTAPGAGETASSGQVQKPSKSRKHAKSKEKRMIRRREERERQCQLPETDVLRVARHGTVLMRVEGVEYHPEGWLEYDLSTKRIKLA